MKKEERNGRFVGYYAEKSLSQKDFERFMGIKRAVLMALKKSGRADKGRGYQVADISCNTGAQSAIWAKSGHQVIGVDINNALLEVARKRSVQMGLNINFRQASAAALPIEDKSIDICLVPELLEHVKQWEACLNEFSRILKPGGCLFISTTNRICPVQDEFAIPFYSWFPEVLKKKYVHLAKTTRPDLVNFAEYPAVNWFTVRQLKKELTSRSFICYDRFDLMEMETFSTIKKKIASVIASSPFLKHIACMATPGSIAVGIKKSNRSG